MTDDAVWIIVIFLAIVLFAGKPNLVQTIIHRLDPHPCICAEEAK